MKSALIDRVAWVGEPFVKGEIRGVVLRFGGLNGTTGMKGDADAHELEWGHAGALVVHPYYNPWAWMNGATVSFVDELVEAVRDKYALSASLPVVATGGSMGGHAALAYALKSRLGVAACLANCPVCDLAFHYSERPDLPRTFHSAFGGYGDIEERLNDYSPLRQAAKMPRIPYLIVHGEKDQAVAKPAHSDKFCQAMRALGHDLTYREEPGMAHCGPLTYDAFRAIADFVQGSLASRAG